MSTEEEVKAEEVSPELPAPDKEGEPVPKKVKIPARKKGSFTSKDRHTCIALHAMGHTPIDVEYRNDPKFQMFYRFQNSALEDLKRYTLGEDVTVKVRDYEEAEKRFRANLHLGQEQERASIT